jgi:predicted ester cyclase
MLVTTGESSISTDQNKAVVRRFITEVLAGGNLDVLDELCGSEYVNRGMGDIDLTTFKAMLPAMAAALPERRLDIQDLVAEGGAVVARFSYDLTDAAGNKISARGLTYYRLANGKIVEDDPITSPDMAQILGGLMPTAAP